ncbi:type II toxin-antitoxin system HigB family toxin [Puia dinghuensis]|uniref:type II toxin-antitoxin system HigB family toxin n=1 Tax=Puia dinghuensis TaxID=1792502 RepID=UPI001E3C82E4|nr:type II toxin-antitoxin system HigB family toxin [Puia dinghuensis]
MSSWPGLAIEHRWGGGAASGDRISKFFKKYAFRELFCIFTLPYLMKVHLIKRQTIEQFAKENARSRPSFKLWLQILGSADWAEPEDILETFGSADLLGNGCNRVVFDIGGNSYRMICHYVIGDNQVHLFVCWIGTHAEYTKLCNARKQYKISIY